MNWEDRLFESLIEEKSSSRWKNIKTALKIAAIVAPLPVASYIAGKAAKTNDPPKVEKVEKKKKSAFGMMARQGVSRGLGN